MNINISMEIIKTLVNFFKYIKNESNLRDMKKHLEIENPLKIEKRVISRQLIPDDPNIKYDEEVFYLINDCDIPLLYVEVDVDFFKKTHKSGENVNRYDILDVGQTELFYLYMHDYKNWNIERRKLKKLKISYYIPKLHGRSFEKKTDLCPIYEID